MGKEVGRPCRSHYFLGGIMSLAQEASSFGCEVHEPIVSDFNTTTYREVYDRNRHRIYALAICLTDDKVGAEKLVTKVFSRAFAKREVPTPEDIDGSLIAEVEQFVRLGPLTLDCDPGVKSRQIRPDLLRVDVERAVTQLPFTERLIFLMHDVENYEHARIARTLGITDRESRLGLYQARLRMRELLTD
jgi:DNA-directed RNA polymerase specialized sigma24 family protein